MPTLQALSETADGEDEVASDAEAKGESDLSDTLAEVSTADDTGERVSEDDGDEGNRDGSSSGSGDGDQEVAEAEYSTPPQQQ